MSKQKFKSQEVLVTAGPTRAYLDDVRFLSNFSSGELGFLICGALKRKGINVRAVVGPSAFPFSDLGLKQVSHVETNGEMLAESLKILRRQSAGWAVFSAAVLDFVPKQRKRGKVSSNQQKWTLNLVPAPKIIDTVHQEFPSLKKIGFKLESIKRKGPAQDLFASKLMKKRDLEMLVLNYRDEVKRSSHVAYLYKKGAKKPLVLKTKKAIAEAIATMVSNG